MGALEGYPHVIITRVPHRIVRSLTAVRARCFCLLSRPPFYSLIGYLGSRPPPPPKSLTYNTLPTVPVDWHPTPYGAVLSLVNPRQYLREEERSPTGRPFPFFRDYPKPTIPLPEAPCTFFTK